MTRLRVSSMAVMMLEGAQKSSAMRRGVQAGRVIRRLGKKLRALMRSSSTGSSLGKPTRADIFVDEDSFFECGTCNGRTLSNRWRVHKIGKGSLGGRMLRPAARPFKHPIFKYRWCHSIRPLSRLISGSSAVWFENFRPYVGMFHVCLHINIFTTHLHISCFFRPRPSTSFTNHE